VVSDLAAFHREVIRDEVPILFESRKHVKAEVCVPIIVVMSGSDPDGDTMCKEPW